MFQQLFRSFFQKPYNGSVGKNNELNRQQWVARQLQALPAGLKILDAGAGEMQYKQYCGHLDYFSQDFAGYDPKQLPSGLQMEQWDYGELDYVCDIASIPVSAESFDVILCTEVFEHIVHPLETLREFNRILKKGGKLILTAPFCSLTHFAPYHFYTGFSRFFYETQFKEMGYELEELSSNGNYFEYVAQELRRLKSVAHTYSTNSSLTTSELASIQVLLTKLDTLSAKDTGSSALLCYGFHVVACKR
jgi:ubiquinone/menaquinone biosynthesis C-methylase UbiE